MYAILVPPVLVLVFVGIMVFESNYTLFTRIIFFAGGASVRACFRGELPGKRRFRLNHLWARAIFEIPKVGRYCRNFRIQGRRTADWNRKEFARNFLAGVDSSALILLG